MPDRSWFLAANGQQQGPYPEAQLRDFIARGMVTAQTLVWTEGMAGWQKAGEVPGLMSAAGARQVIPQADGPLMSTGGRGPSLSVDFGIWDFTWRSVLLFLGVIVIIPTPWVVCWYTNWILSCVHVPGRPNLSFMGTPGTIALWYFPAIVLVIIFEIIGAMSERGWIGAARLENTIEIVLYWLFLRYLVANLASNGQLLGLSLGRSFWSTFIIYLGWNILLGLSIITIIGWAWVMTALIRWICRNIQGTRRQVVFKGTGLEYLWRMIVTVFASAFIIPIPWVCRWMIKWQSSQTELVEHDAYAKI
jgi:GYF domain 2